MPGHVQGAQSTQSAPEMFYMEDIKGSKNKNYTHTSTMSAVCNQHSSFHQQMCCYWPLSQPGLRLDKGEKVQELSLKTIFWITKNEL